MNADASLESGRKSRPNVLLIHTDQQRFDSLGCCGNPHARTPNLDALAADGVVFTRHIASNSACMPSRASLMTGQYPLHHDCFVNGVPLPRREYLADTMPDEFVREPQTMADMFAAAGYDTASFGKLHFTPHLADRVHRLPESLAMWESTELHDWHGPYYGFEHHEATIAHGDLPGGHYELWLKREHPDVHAQALAMQQGGERPIPQLDDLYASPVPFELRTSRWIADRVDRYLRDRPDPANPFFFFVGFPDPHHPFTPSHDVAAMFEDSDVLPSHDPEGEYATHSRIHQKLMAAGRLCPATQLTEAQRRRIIQYTYALVHEVDQAVGRLLESLRVQGLSDNTIVVFTSDHGDFLCDHGLIRKHEIGSDSLLRVPLIIRVPQMDLPDRIDDPVSNTDVMPTLAALCSLSCVPVDGGDIFARHDAGGESYAFAQNCQIEPWVANYTIYDRHHRLTWYPRLGLTELFDHRDDPGETRNLAGDSKVRDIEKSLMARLGPHMMETVDPTLGRLAIY